MNHLFRFTLTAALLLVCVIATAQQAKILDSINLYGSLRSHFAVYKKDVELQNNASRIGCYLQRGVWKGITAEAKVELGINLIKNNNSFNPDAATASDPSGFLTQTTQPVSTRLGYIGLSKNKWGTLLIGKQWSVYYDVSKFTDEFNVFGASASGTYNTNTDGGSEGTGRAESAITYRNRWNNFSLGLQGQFPGSTYNFGGSLLYSLPNGFTIGTAYNYYDVPDNIREVVINSKKTASSLVVAIKFASKKSYVALCYAYNQSEIQYPASNLAVGFLANGFEVYAHHYFTTEFQLFGGVNYLLPVGSPDSLSEEFRVFYFPVGAAYYFLPDFFCYAEIKIDAGITATGAKASSVFAIGLKYNFSFGHGVIKTPWK